MFDFFMLLLDIFGEVLMQLFAEVLLEYGLEGLSHAFGTRRSANPILAGFGLLIVGAAAGLLSAALLPHRLFNMAAPFTGISLIVAPLATGLAMYAFGSWCRRRGVAHSSLATFWGGALFAFAMALTRWLIIGRAG